MLRGMADERGTPLQHASVHVTGTLLATKLHVPRPPRAFVSRARLLGRMEEPLPRGVILVCAPAGSGKSALLADWARQRDQQVGWLSLDGGDNDPVRFWRHVIGAVDGVRPGMAEQISPLLGSPSPSLEAVAGELINALAAQPGQVWLILDDYHVIDAEDVHSSVVFLLEHAPPELRVVLAGRVDPPLPLARWRARGRLAQLTAADLRFTEEEAASLLREAVTPELDRDAVAVLVARTEGWAAGLQLAALSLHGRPHVGDFVEQFSGSHRYVLDYLTEEVLEGQPPDIQQFLVETSVLEGLTGPLCDAVTGRTDGQEMLEAVEGANLFLMPMDEERGWWRYHRLFADLLRARLQRRHPERAATLHRRAGMWLEAQGSASEAVGHALAAGDGPWAAGLVERHAEAFIMCGEQATVQRWISALPLEELGARPRLLAAQARLAILRGRLEAAASTLEAAERALPEATDDPYEPSVDSGVSALTNVAAVIAVDRALLANLRGDPDEANRFADAARARLGDGEWMLDALARTHLATAEWLRGRPAEAEFAIAANVARWRSANIQDIAALWSYHLAHIQHAQGRLDAALETCNRTLEGVAADDGPSPPFAGVAHVGMAEVAYQRDDLDTAADHAVRGIALARQFPHAQPLAMGLATLAWIRHATGDSDGARQAMTEAEQVAPTSVVDLLNPVPAQQARLLLAQGQVTAAERWAAEQGLRTGDAPLYRREPAWLVFARLLLVQGHPDHAVHVLESLHEAATAQRRIGSVIEIQALRALALAGSDNEAAALAALAEALTLASPHQYVRVFADEGPPMAALLGRLVASQRSDHAPTGVDQVGSLGRIVRAFRDGSPANGTPPARAIAGLVTPLSPRELEVLHLLATGASNQKIADELFVALNTIKKHVTHIFDKLGAANRTEATARARDLGLLP